MSNQDNQMQNDTKLCMSVESKSNLVSPAKGGRTSDQLGYDKAAQEKDATSPGEKDDPKAALKRFNQCVPIKSSQVIEMNESNQVYHLKNEDDYLKKRGSVISNHANDTYYTKGTRNYPSKISIPSMVSNSRQSDSLLYDRLDKIDDQLFDNQKDEKFDDLTVNLNKDEAPGSGFERLRPQQLRIQKESERQQAQDQQLPQGLEMIFMNNSDQNEKLLIDMGSATSITDLRSPLELKLQENTDKSPYMQALQMANNENFPKLISRNNSNKALQSFTDIRNSIKLQAEASGRPSSSQSEQLSDLQYDELSQLSSSQQIQVVSVLNRDSRGSEPSSTSEFTLNTHGQNKKGGMHQSKCSDLFSLSGSLLRANGLVQSNNNDTYQNLEQSVEPDSGESIGTQVKNSQMQVQFLKPPLSGQHLRQQSSMSVQTMISETSVQTVKTLNSGTSAVSQFSSQSLTDQGFNKANETENEVMWRMVETIRNKSTILKSRKINMERNGQPTLHMEIIEEEPLQENVGTDFKKLGRNNRYHQVEEESEDPQSNQSSPDVKIEKVLPDSYVIEQDKRLTMGAVQNQGKSYQLKYFDVDVNADPPSKSEPPSSLPFDEPPSGSYFRDLESPQNHPPLRRLSCIRKSKDDFKDQLADAVELPEHNSLEQKTFESNRIEKVLEIEVLNRPSLEILGKSDKSPMMALTSNPSSQPSSRLNMAYLAQANSTSSSQSIEQLKNNLIEKMSEIHRDRLLAQKFDCNPEFTKSSVHSMAPDSQMSMVRSEISGRQSIISSRNESHLAHRRYGSNTSTDQRTVFQPAIDVVHVDSQSEIDSAELLENFKNKILKDPYHVKSKKNSNRSSKVSQGKQSNRLSVNTFEKRLKDSGKSSNRKIRHSNKVLHQDKTHGEIQDLRTACGTFISISNKANSYVSLGATQSLSSRQVASQSKSFMHSVSLLSAKGLASQAQSQKSTNKKIKKTSSKKNDGPPEWQESRNKRLFVQNKSVSVEQKSKFESMMLRPPPMKVKSNRKSKPNSVKKEMIQETSVPLSTFGSISSNSDDMKEFCEEMTEATDLNFARSLKVKETVLPITVQKKFVQKDEKENQTEALQEKASQLTNQTQGQSDQRKGMVLKDKGLNFLQQKANLYVPPQQYFTKTEFKCSFAKLNQAQPYDQCSAIPTEGQEPNSPKASTQVLNDFMHKNNVRSPNNDCFKGFCGTANKNPVVKSQMPTIDRHEQKTQPRHQKGCKSWSDIRFAAIELGQANSQRLRQIQMERQEKA